MLGKLKPDHLLDPQTEGTRTNLLLQHVQTCLPNPAVQILVIFAQKTQDEEVLQCLARILYMLSGDAAVSSVVPFKCHDLLLSLVEDTWNYLRKEPDLLKLREYCVELSELLVLGLRNDCVEEVCNFCEYLVSHVKEVHSVNRPAPDVQPIPGTYDPASGTAYYFTESGEQLRIMPTYEVLGRTGNNNYDDHPQVEELCNKYFPQVSFGGFGYMFLWFCPIHGHCYGFHLIAGGEGRKDPFSSVFKYMENPPEHLYYDFACQLSEYCLNREPELFKNTRFWHDLFHSIPHLCGPNFKSGRVYGLEGVNSEICEQVNSFLQCVKYTASHLSQEHFVFFMQFFLYLMNKEKTEKFKKLASVALAGQM